MFRRLHTVAILGLLALRAPLSAQTDIHGTWTAELREGKVFLQVRTAPPSA